MGGVKPVSALLGECFKLKLKRISSEKLRFPARYADEKRTVAVLRQHILIAVIQPMNAAQKTECLQRIEQAVDGGAPGVRTFTAHKLPRFFGAQRKGGTGQRNKQRFFRRGNTRTARLECLQPFGWLDGCGRHCGHLNDTKSHLHFVLIPRLIWNRKVTLGNCNVS